MFPVRNRRFVDLFAGCGGLSLGLSQAGWRGIFAIEHDEMAFRTFAENFLRKGSKAAFSWPRWLERRPWAIEDLLGQHRLDLRRLRGSIQLVAGGPPCQGFSFAGLRRKNDPRNQLFRKYVEFVDAVQPDYVLIENVPGIQVAHGKLARQKGRPGRPPTAYGSRLISALSAVGYTATPITLDASHFGVPQTRVRIFIVGVRQIDPTIDRERLTRLMRQIDISRRLQLDDLGISIPVTASEAIGDLEVQRCGLGNCNDPESPAGFFVPRYRGPVTPYQRLMNDGLGTTVVDSGRLARHGANVTRRFKQIITECRPGVHMHLNDRRRLGLRKHRIHPMAWNLPAPTITTLPDDILHYLEPRILSVRESARLQSFPDSFRFVGKYTTGGHRRRRECPRYTQVGNAVPPLVGRAIGHAIIQVMTSARDTSATLNEPAMESV